MIPAVGVHAFLSAAHAGGQKHGRVLRLNLATGQLQQQVYRTNAPRQLAVSHNVLWINAIGLCPHCSLLEVHKRMGCYVELESSRAFYQVSPKGNFVATFDKHTLLVWPTKLADKKPLALHHTKSFTVSMYYMYSLDFLSV